VSEDDGRRATVHDVAREAGVSLATVDRVLNGRPGVRPGTAQKVEDAIGRLDFRRDLSASLLARSRDLNLRFLIPDGANEFMDHLADAVGRRARAAKAERLRIETTRLAALDAEGVAAQLDALGKASCDCVVVVATDEPAVVRAVDAASRRGVQVLTLVSDLPGSSRRQFIGIDNLAAGRTAGSLMGRFCPTGEVAIVAGSLGLRDHAERLAGFLDVARVEFPGLTVIGPVEAHDRDEETKTAIRRLLAEHPGLAGIYNLGAGNAGLIAAVEDWDRPSRPRVIAHELTTATRRGLASGAIDVVLDQNPDAEITAAIVAARALAHHDGNALAPGRIEIGIFLRDNLR